MQTTNVLPLDADGVWLECEESTAERIRVVVRWGTALGSELSGLIAAEFLFLLDRDRDECKAWVKLHGDADLDMDFVVYLCKVYGLRGTVDVEAVRLGDIQNLGTAKVRF